MEILYVLLVLLVVTRSFGELAVRAGQPALVGELVSGIVLGGIVRAVPERFPLLAGLSENEVFVAITDLGIFFLMLLAGLEMRPKEILESSKGALAVAVGGMVIPLGAGIALGLAVLPESDYRLAQLMFLGTSLAITAVPVAVKVLMDLGKLDSRAGRVIVSAAIFDDVLSLVLLAILTALIRTGELPQASGLAVLGLQVLAFFVIAVLLGLTVLPRIARLWRFGNQEELEFSSLLVVALGYAVLAEALELHFILGAFFAGLFFNRQSMQTEVFEAVRSKVSGLTTGFLAPVFFASIGLHLDPGAVTAIPWFLGLFVLAAVSCKVLGAGLPAWMTGLSPRESLVVGMGMSARGAVELVIADVALRAGLFSRPEDPPPIVEHLFSAVVMMAVLTTLFTPVGLRWVMGKRGDTTEA